MRYTIEQLDTMEGHEFEYAVADILRHNGWRDVTVTQGSGDYGIDILARRGSTRYAIQCKRYNSAVGVKAVQEAGLGVDYYNYDAAAVITNNTFTKQAENIAKTTGVRLWGRDYLKELITNYDEGYDEFYTQSSSMDVNTTNTGISKVCPTCDREFLNSSLKCPICDCDLIHISAQKKENKNPQSKISLQGKQKPLSHSEEQQHTMPQNKNDKKNNSQFNKPSKLSITALVLSILGITCFFGIILAIIELFKKDEKKKTIAIIALLIGCLWFSLIYNSSDKNKSVINKTISQPYDTGNETEAQNIKEDSSNLQNNLTDTLANLFPSSHDYGNLLITDISNGEYIIQYEYTRTLWNENDLVSHCISDYINYCVEAYQLDTVNNISFAIFVPLSAVDEKGNKTENMNHVISIQMKESAFNTFVWTNLEYTNIYDIFTKNCDNFYLAPEIGKYVNTSEIIYLPNS